jgi:hypothetical protein
MINSGIDGPFGYKVYSNDGNVGIDTGMYYNVDHWDFYVAGDLKYASFPGNYSDPSQAQAWSGVSGADPTPTFAGYGGDVKVWNLNIIRTINELGSTGSTTGYTTYGSTTFNGIKQVFGFNPDQRNIGIIYRKDSNIDIDDTGRIQPSSTTIYMPTILWHRKPEFISGRGIKGGHFFTDRKGTVQYDSVAQLPYSNLKDGIDNNAITVGRVYHDLRMIVITHQDLLSAMSYKSNRNWTVPPLRLSLQDNYISNTTGLCKNDKVYLATYAFTSDAAYSSGASFSYRNSIHCGDISWINGIEGGPHSLIARFDQSQFPYLRSSSGIVSYSGTGWNMNDLNILVKEIDSSEFSGVSTVSGLGWKKLNSGGEYSNQHSETTISASGLTSYQFTINQNDYDGATNYSIDSINGDPFDRAFSGLSYGDEVFFFGSVEYDINKAAERATIKIRLLPNDFNSTKNSTYSLNNECTYVTGLYILDDLNRVVASAKPSNPIKKDQSRLLEFKLDILY